MCGAVAATAATVYWCILFCLPGIPFHRHMPVVSVSPPGSKRPWLPHKGAEDVATSRHKVHEQYAHVIGPTSCLSRQTICLYRQQHASHPGRWPPLRVHVCWYGAPEGRGWCGVEEKNIASHQWRVALSWMPEFQRFPGLLRALPLLEYITFG